MPEGSLIESHDHSRVIIVGFVFRVVVEQGHVPVSVVLKIQGVQVVGREIDLDLWISPEVRREPFRGVGQVLIFHIPIDNACSRFEDLEHPLSWIRTLILQAIQIAKRIAEVGLEISHRKEKKRVQAVVAGRIIDPPCVHYRTLPCQGQSFAIVIALLVLSLHIGGHESDELFPGRKR